MHHALIHVSNVCTYTGVFTYRFFIIIAIAAILVLVSLVAESIGFLIGTLTIEYDKAMSIGTLVAIGMVSFSNDIIIDNSVTIICLLNFTLQMIFGGFYIDITGIPEFLRWLRYLAIVYNKFDNCLLLLIRVHCC